MSQELEACCLPGKMGHVSSGPCYCRGEPEKNFGKTVDVGR